MECILFQLKKLYYYAKGVWVDGSSGHLGFGDDTFSTICKTFVLEIPDEEFNLG